MYFETEITFTVKQLEAYVYLREGLNIAYVVSAERIYNIISQSVPIALENTVNGNQMALEMMI